MRFLFYRLPEPLEIDDFFVFHFLFSFFNYTLFRERAAAGLSSKAREWSDSFRRERRDLGVSV